MVAQEHPLVDKDDHEVDYEVVAYHQGDDDDEEEDEGDGALVGEEGLVGVEGEEKGWSRSQLMLLIFFDDFFVDLNERVFLLQGKERALLLLLLMQRLVVEVVV